MLMGGIHLCTKIPKRINVLLVDIERLRDGTIVNEIMPQKHIFVDYLKVYSYLLKPCHNMFFQKR